MSGQLNEGRLTDRFEVRWVLKSDRAKAVPRAKSCRLWKRPKTISYAHQRVNLRSICPNA